MASQVAKKYGVLRTLASLLQIVAVVALVGGIYLLTQAFNSPNSVTTFLVPAGALLASLELWASAEVIQVIIDIEENTRVAAQRAQPAAPSAAA